MNKRTALQWEKVLVPLKRRVGIASGVAPKHFKGMTYVSGRPLDKADVNCLLQNAPSQPLNSVSLFHESLDRIRCLGYVAEPKSGIPNRGNYENCITKIVPLCSLFRKAALHRSTLPYGVEESAGRRPCVPASGWQKPEPCGGTL